MKSELPAIAKHAARVAAAIEEAVTRFPRRHKYGLGADLRGDAMQVMRAVRVGELQESVKLYDSYKRDAERYRWLRICGSRQGNIATLYWEDRLDAAIDAALQSDSKDGA